MHKLFYRAWLRTLCQHSCSNAAALLAVLGLVSGIIAGVACSSSVVAAEAAQQKPTFTLSKKVLPLLKAANDASLGRQYDAMLKKIDEADAVDKKTDYDQFRIEEFRALAYLGQNKNYEEALSIYEKHLSTPEYLDPQQLEVRLKVLTQLAFHANAYAKVADYGKQWMTTHPDDTRTLDLIARAHYLSKDYKGTLEVVKVAIGVAESSGKVPDELWLQLMPSCASNLDDQQGVIAGYEKLVRYYPKAEHWTKVLETALRIEKNDLATLYVLRLMSDTGVLVRPEYYFEYSQRAVEQALPGEAQRILETGFEKKILGATAKEHERYQRALTDVKQKAQTDRAQLPEIEKELRASKSKTGQIGAGLGLAYFGYEMYDQAIPTLEASIAKGGLRNIDDYRMALGIAYWRTAQKEKARVLFQAVPANSPLERVAAFWTARSYN